MKPESPVDLFVEIESVAVQEYMLKSNTPRSVITCFRCGEEGHYKSECLQWKTRICWHNQKGMCRDGNACSFAHDVSELRSPWIPKCMRIIKKDGKIYRMGCLAMGHTYKHCPMLESQGGFNQPLP
jgi:hypothetical protein